jgi:hypothetical protein
MKLQIQALLPPKTPKMHVQIYLMATLEFKVRLALYTYKIQNMHLYKHT